MSFSVSVAHASLKCLRFNALRYYKRDSSFEKQIKQHDHIMLKCTKINLVFLNYYDHIQADSNVFCAISISKYINYIREAVPVMNNGVGVRNGTLKGWDIHVNVVD